MSTKTGGRGLVGLDVSEAKSQSRRWSCHGARVDFGGVHLRHGRLDERER